MAKYIVNKNAIQDIEYLAFLCHQLRFYERSFEEWANQSDADQVKNYKALMDDWLKNNVVKVAQ